MVKFLGQNCYKYLLCGNLLTDSVKKNTSREESSF
jgi:hypothetical protein